MDKQDVKVLLIHSRVLSNLTNQVNRHIEGNIVGAPSRPQRLAPGTGAHHRFTGDHATASLLCSVRRMAHYDRQCLMGMWQWQGQMSYPFLRLFHRNLAVWSYAPDNPLYMCTWRSGNTRHDCSCGFVYVSYVDIQIPAAAKPPSVISAGWFVVVVQ